MKLNLLTLISFLILCSFVSTAQNYEIKFDTLSASGWFGGDNRPGQQRNVAVAQSVFIEEPITLESFAFYFTAPFDYALNGTGTGHDVLLKLHIRDSLGTILQANQVFVGDTFYGGWVTWSNINLDLTDAGKYIFSAYLVGGYDSNMVNSGQGCDQFAGYLGGERYNKYVTNDQEAETWGDWSPHPWDSNFWLTGTLITTSVNDPEILKEFSLLQNYPNPFNPETIIKYAIGSNQFVTLKVYDVLGNEVATLVNEEIQAGSHTVIFDASNLSSGIYLYKLTSGSFRVTKKMTLLK
jgi:hypothetical protein